MKIKVASLRNHCGLQFIVVQLEFFMFFYLNIIELFLFLKLLIFYSRIEDLPVNHVHDIANQYDFNMFI